jgi:hypothetical protein
VIPASALFSDLPPARSKQTLYPQKARQLCVEMALGCSAHLDNINHGEVAGRAQSKAPDGTPYEYACRVLIIEHSQFTTNPTNILEHRH